MRGTRSPAPPGLECWTRGSLAAKQRLARDIDAGRVVPPGIAEREQPKD
jgi:hypothetical protein